MPVRPLGRPPVALFASLLLAALLLGAPGRVGATEVGALGGAADGAAARPDDSPYVIAVIGDSLAQGIWEAVYRRLQRDPRFEVVRQTRPATGITRWDVFDWEAALADFLDQRPVDAAIVGLGLNDMQALHLPDGSFHPFRSAAWDAAFQERVEAMMGALTERGIATFWLGLPIMRSAGYSENIRHLNALYAASAERMGVAHIPLWEVAADSDGRFAAHLPDARGRTRPMRDNDGIHFTLSGYEMLGRHILDAMAEHLPALAER